jgi:hypothetical protein
MAKSFGLRLFLILVMSLMLIVLTGTSPQAGKIGPQCVQCTFRCNRVYQECMMVNSPCDNECQEQCFAERDACQQANCVDTGICPDN